MNDEQKMRLKIYLWILPKHLNYIYILQGVFWLFYLWASGDYFRTVLAYAGSFSKGELVITMGLVLIVIMINALGLFHSISRQWFYSEAQNSEYQEKVAEALSK